MRIAHKSTGRRPVAGYLEIRQAADIGRLEIRTNDLGHSERPAAKRGREAFLSLSRVRLLDILARNTRPSVEPFLEKSEYVATTPEDKAKTLDPVM